jgi:glycosyltransferase involved in cell wall biosynthesis
LEINIVPSKLILYVPQPDKKSTVQAGGQYTAATGLINYLKEIDYPYAVVNTTPLDTEQSRWSKATFALSRIKKIRGFTRKEPSIVLAFTGSFYSLMERFILLSLTRCQLALGFRNNEILNISPSSLKGRLISIFLKKVKVIFVQGENLKNYLQVFGIEASKIQVVPNWLPASCHIVKHPIMCPDRATIHIVMVARIVKAKGIFEFIKAISLLDYSITKFKVDIVGGGEDLEQAKAYCVSLNISSRVTFHGWKSSEQIKEFLKQSHLFVLPSYNEGFPNSILEAMAHGLPVVSTNVGAISESVIDGENGFIVKIKDSISLAAAINEYLHNPSLLEIHSIYSLNIVSERHNRKTNCATLIQHLFPNN